MALNRVSLMQLKAKTEGLFSTTVLIFFAKTAESGPLNQDVRKNF
jgi:hypothetical protein